MGNFFTSIQIHNSKQISKEQFIELFCKEMKEEGYATCDSDESELSYILRFADNCKWVTITSTDYEQGNQTSQKDTGRIAKMLKTACVNTVVIDSDCAIMDFYDESGKKADSLILGRADDYFGDNIPQPSKNVWSQFLSNGSTWEQVIEVKKAEYVFVEEGLAKLAPLISMDINNITFSAEDAVDEPNTVFLDFKKARSAIIMSQAGKEIKSPKPLTLNAAFKQIVGKALEPYGFKVIKGRHPYIVRVINNEILHIITFCPENPEYPPDKAFAIMGGIATIYRKKITFDLSPKQNYVWLNYMFKFYNALVSERDVNVLGQLFKSCYYSDRSESLISVLNNGAENLIKYVLPIMDNVNDIDSCLDYMQKFLRPCNPRQCTEICSYYPNEDESFLYFLSDKKKEYSDILSNFENDSEFNNWVMREIEKRKNENTEILKSYDLIDIQKGV